MGTCFSKKEDASSPPSPPTTGGAATDKKREEKPPSKVVVEAATTEKKQVFVITHKGAAAAAAAVNVKEKKVRETPTKKANRDLEVYGAAPVVAVPAVVEEFKPTAVIRTSSCTKEEVDAILIQCGRLSRSSSGKASNENEVGYRKYSGSKRSYDFDNEKKGDEEWEEKPVSRPSPHRRTPGRERSGSRERGSGGGGRRVSRSPGRRSEVPASSGGTSERSKQPAKMVAVPAREKSRGACPAPAANKRGAEVGAVRNASPRSRSPAGAVRVLNENAASHHAPLSTQPQSLSGSSSRKADQSPYRRNPMAEIDENCLRGNQNNSKVQRTREGEEGMRKQIQCQVQKTNELGAQGSRSLQRNGDRVHGKMSMETAGLEEAIEKLASSKVTEESQIPRTISRTKSSRRSSRDFDHASLGLNQESFLNPNSLPSSLLLDDIQAYNQQHPSAAFSLPACISKACSILEAVADLNSTSSENNSGNGRRGLALNQQQFVESEIVAKDDLLEPSLHKYVTVRELGGGGDMEPQESAGSNSFTGQAWASSAWEPNSVDSYWSNNGDEVEQEAKLSPLSQGPQQRPQQQPQECGARGRRLSGVSGNSRGSGNVVPATLSEKKRELHQRSQLRGAGSIVRGGGGRFAAAASSS